MGAAPKLQDPAITLAQGEKRKALIAYCQNQQNLPKLPISCVKILELTGDMDKFENRKLIAILKQDPSLAAQVLRVANSALYAPPEPITAIEDAAFRLGAEPIRELALAQGMTQAFESYKLNPSLMKDFWNQSLQVAYLAQTILANSEVKSGHPVPNPGDCFTAGLIQDLGFLIVVKQFPQETMALVEKRKNAPGELKNFESDTYGMEHHKLSAEICRFWKLPKACEEVCEYIYDPFASDLTNLHLVQITHVAYVLNLFKDGLRAGSVKKLPIDPQIFIQLGLEAGKIPEYLKQAEDQVAQGQVL